MHKPKMAIPVPLEYWTIIYDSDANEAIGFLTSNDPHSKDIATEKCKNICNEINWIKDLLDDFKDETEGHTTCCTVKNLQKHIESIKNLESRDGKKLVKASTMTDYR